MKPKILCICKHGKTRSKYLSSYLKKKGYKTRYGGLAPNAVKKIRQKDIDWADTIIFVRKGLPTIAKNKFKIKNKNIIRFHVSDSRKKVGKRFPKLRDLPKNKFHKLWTYPKLEKAIQTHFLQTPHFVFTDPSTKTFFKQFGQTLAPQEGHDTNLFSKAYFPHEEQNFSRF